MCACACGVQANVNPTLPPEEWPLDALAAKMKQYCYLLEDLTPELLREECGDDYEELRAYLRQRGTDAYWQKVRLKFPPSNGSQTRTPSWL